jgi:hypothetical protein
MTQTDRLKAELQTFFPTFSPNVFMWEEDHAA